MQNIKFDANEIRNVLFDLRCYLTLRKKEKLKHSPKYVFILLENVTYLNYRTDNTETMLSYIYCLCKMTVKLNN